jgi:hypothetical protein
MILHDKVNIPIDTWGCEKWAKCMKNKISIDMNRGNILDVAQSDK